MVTTIEKSLAGAQIEILGTGISSVTDAQGVFHRPRPAQFWGQTLRLVVRKQGYKTIDTMMTAGVPWAATMHPEKKSAPLFVRLDKPDYHVAALESLRRVVCDNVLWTKPLRGTLACRAFRFVRTIAIATNLVDTDA